MKYAGIPARAFLRERIPLLAWRGAGRLGLTRRRMATLLGREALPRSDVALLELMRSDNDSARSPYQATEHWKRLNRQFDEWFRWEGIGEVELQTMNQSFASPPPTDPKLLRYATWMLYKAVEARDELGLLDAVPATIGEESGRAFRFDGRLVSWDSLLSLDHLYSIYEVDHDVLRAPNVFVELGAGWGRLAYALRRANRSVAYVICDLPESLLVSSRYLPRLLADERFHNYPDVRLVERFTRDELLSAPGVWFLAPQQLDRFADDTADFFASVASFQEMTRDQVSEYFAVIDRILRGVFYTLQLRSSATHRLHLGEISGLADYSFPPAWTRELLRSPSWSDLYFEAVFRSAGRDRGGKA
jgi:putative sugar O-methyltransferase